MAKHLRPVSQRRISATTAGNGYATVRIQRGSVCHLASRVHFGCRAHLFVYGPGLCRYSRWGPKCLRVNSSNSGDDFSRVVSGTGLRSPHRTHYWGDIPLSRYGLQPIRRRHAIGWFGCHHGLRPASSGANRCLFRHRDSRAGGTLDSLVPAKQLLRGRVSCHPSLLASVLKRFPLDGHGTSPAAAV